MKVILAFVALVVSVEMRGQTQNDVVMDSILQEARQYLTGIGKPKDEAKALSIFRYYAGQGSAKAMNALGIVYKEGTGVKADRETAVEWFTKAGNLGYGKSWYNLGMLYKEAKTPAERNYEKAYEYFCKASSLKDDQGTYAKAYMLYKGLGCIQDYSQAAPLFQLGAQLNRANSMFFWALCLRNGYGVESDPEDATYWLKKASKKGYKAADYELSTTAPENSNTEAKALAQKLREAEPNKDATVNSYTKIEHRVPANAIEGVYKGYMVRYDWSGKHAIHSAPLSLELSYIAGKLTGKWIEADTLIVPIEAILTPRSMVFKHTQYSRTDHYSFQYAVKYEFNDARLKWSHKGDSVFLSGNIQMFSPERNEPEKPMYIALSRSATLNDNAAVIDLVNEDGTALSDNNDLKAWPNPFTKTIAVEFNLRTSCIVQMELLTMEGKVVYQNPAGKLDAGDYMIQVQPKDLPAGTYMLVLKYGDKAKTTKLVKL